MKSTLIIAEAGVNHNGDIAIAKDLIKVASRSGADIIKFQTFKTENLVTKDAKKAEYQKSSSDKNDAQFEMLKNLELDEFKHKELIEVCKDFNIEFLSSAFDLESLNLLKSLNLELFYRVSTGLNFLFLKT